MMHCVWLTASLSSDSSSVSRPPSRYAPDIAGFVLFVAVMVGVCAAIGVLLVRERPVPPVEDDANVRRAFYVGYALTAVLAAQLVGSALASEFMPGYGEHARVAMTALTAVLLATTIASLLMNRDSAGGPAGAEPFLLDAKEKKRPLTDGEAAAGLKEYSLLEAACTLDFCKNGSFATNQLHGLVPSISACSLANRGCFFSLSF